MLVLCIILLVLALLFNLSAVVDVNYTDGEFNYCVRYAFVKLLNSENPPDEKKEKKNKNKKSDTAKKKPVSDKKGKQSSSKKKKAEPKETLDEKLEKLEAVIDFIKSSQDRILGLISKIRFSKINVDFIVADEDAYDCAVTYGMVNAGVYNILGFISSYFRTAIDRVNIGLKYNNNNSVYNFSFSLKLKLGTGIYAAAAILLKYLGAGNLFGKKKKNKIKESEKSKECLNMSDHPVNSLMGTAIEKIRNMIDVNTIIGNPITTPEGATIIPVSKVSFGFASGGSDLPSKQQKDLFGGAAGAGVSVQPLAFICVSPSGDVKLLQMSVNATKENAMITTLPDLIDKISALVNKDGGEKAAKGKKKVKKESAAAEEEAEAEE